MKIKNNKHKLKIIDGCIANANELRQVIEGLEKKWELEDGIDVQTPSDEELSDWWEEIILPKLNMIDMDLPIHIFSEHFHIINFYVEFLYDLRDIVDKQDDKEEINFDFDKYDYFCWNEQREKLPPQVANYLKLLLKSKNRRLELDLEKAEKLRINDRKNTISYLAKKFEVPKELIKLILCQKKNCHWIDSKNV